MKKLVALLLTGIMLFALGGCGAADFDAKGYVKAALDAKFHREYDEYADVIGVSKEEARKQMEDEFNESLKTLPTVMSTIQSGGIARSGSAMAATVIMMIPPIVVYLFSQSSIKETMGSAGIKG